MTDEDIKLEDLVVKQDDGMTKVAGKGFVLGFDDPSGDSFIHVCGGCGAFNDFHKHASGAFYFCGSCKKIKAVKSTGCPDPNCPACRAARGER